MKIERWSREMAGDLTETTEHEEKEKENKWRSNNQARAGRRLLLKEKRSEQQRVGNFIPPARKRGAHLLACS